MTGEVDSHEQLEYDDEKYPQLSGNVLDLQLYHWKAIYVHSETYVFPIC